MVEDYKNLELNSFRMVTCNNGVGGIVVYVRITDMKKPRDYSKRRLKR